MNKDLSSFPCICSHRYDEHGSEGKPIDFGGGPQYSYCMHILDEAEAHYCFCNIYVPDKLSYLQQKYETRSK
jgi:hypothetical protein